MIQASKVTLPSRSGRPPSPTDCPLGSASSTLQPFSTASSADAPFCRSSQAAPAAGFTSQVATTRGWFLVLGNSFLEVAVAAWGVLVHDQAAIPSVSPAPVSAEF